MLSQRPSGVFVNKATAREQRYGVRGGAARATSHAALSPERLTPYLISTNGDYTTALRLYEWNLAISGVFYEALSAAVELCGVVVPYGREGQKGSTSRISARSSTVEIKKLRSPRSVVLMEATSRSSCSAACTWVMPFSVRRRSRFIPTAWARVERGVLDTYTTV